MREESSEKEGRRRRAREEEEVEEEVEKERERERASEREREIGGSGRRERGREGGRERASEGGEGERVARVEDKVVEKKETRRTGEASTVGGQIQRTSGSQSDGLTLPSDHRGTGNPVYRNSRAGIWTLFVHPSNHEYDSIVYAWNHDRVTIRVLSSI